MHPFTAAPTEDRYTLLLRAFEGTATSSLVHDEGLRRIYGLSDLSLWCVVDEEDYRYLTEWLWSYSRSPTGKMYIKRSTGNGAVTRDGKQVGWIRGRQKSIYVHRVVMLRAGIAPPSPKHRIVDHINGNSLDCRRKNLRWATLSQNNQNLPSSEARAALLAAE